MPIIRKSEKAYKKNLSFFFLLSHKPTVMREIIVYFNVKDNKSDFY